jgi:hypothetical protein
VIHGFQRTPSGIFQTFRASGAGIGANQGASVTSVNVFEIITGCYIDSTNVSHGFVRMFNGIIMTFDAPGAGKGAGQGTLAVSINALGTIADCRKFREEYGGDDGART